MSAPQNAEHEILRVEPSCRQFGRSPLRGWEFDAICACGARLHSDRSAADAHDRGRLHVQRMQWRKEDAEWLASITRKPDNA